ncbi:hypothetical protein ACE6ED_24125 [Paenibacillus sp. CN-4]|uniref:hypothetical protein n=1 Tax=Paenibacillus nanchangensis TaxID=3348343 RepID=UPI00397E83E6
MRNRRSFFPSLTVPDFKARFRSAGWMYPLMALALLTYFYFPAENSLHSFSAAIRAPEIDGEFRGLYNSAWMGLVTVMFLHTVLLAFGILLVRSSISRDRSLGLGSYFLSSPVSIHRYVEVKRLSNFIYLAGIAFGVELMALVMQLSRGESLQIRILDYVIPYIVLILPFLYVIATAAVALELFRPLRGMAGNVLILVGAIAYLGVMLGGIDKKSINPNADFTGLLFVVDHVSSEFIRNLGLSRWEGDFSFFQNIRQYDHHFVVHSVHWKMEFLLSRLLVILSAGVLLHGIVRLTGWERLFREPKQPSRRDDTQLAASADQAPPVPLAPGALDASASLAAHGSSVATGALAHSGSLRSGSHTRPGTFASPAASGIAFLRPAKLRASALKLLPYELLLAVRGLGRVKAIALLGLLLLSWLPSSGDLSGFNFLLVAAGPLLLLPGIELHGGDPAIRCALGFKRSYFAAKAAAFGVPLVLLFTVPALRLIADGQSGSVLGLLCGLCFALGLGLIGAFYSPHLVGGVYLFLWYTGVVQGLPAADLFGLHGGIAIPALYGAAGVLLMTAAYRKL